MAVVVYGSRSGAPLLCPRVIVRTVLSALHAWDTRHPAPPCNTFDRTGDVP